LRHDPWRRLHFATAFRLAYWLLVVLVFVSAIWLRLRLPLTPIADPDTWGYLSPAMSALMGHGWAHHLRNYLYPGFLFLLLWTFQSFAAVTVAQHLAGLAAGALFLVVWRRLRDFIRAPQLPYPLHQLIGLFGVTTYLYAREPMTYELEIRPEGIVPLLVLLNIFFAIEFSYRCWIRRDQHLPVKWGLAVVASAIVLSLAKPSFTIAALGSILPIMAIFSGKFSRREKAALFLGSLGLTLLLLVPEELTARGDMDARTFLPTQLFIIHAAEIRHQMKADLAAHRSLPYPETLVQGIAQLLDRELANSARNRAFPSLGFNPDFLMYERQSFDHKMRETFQQDRPRLAEFYHFYYERTWRHQPGRMLAKIWRQMLVFYAPRCPAYHLTKLWPISDRYALGLDAFAQAHAKENWSSYEPFRVLLEKTATLAGSGKVLRTSGQTWRWQQLLSQDYLLSCALILGAAGLIFLRRDLRPFLGPLAAVVLFFYWYNFANCFEVAVVHTLDNPRYDRIQLIFTILAQCGAILLIVGVTAFLLRPPHEWPRFSDAKTGQLMEPGRSLSPRRDGSR
jgi:hypothetical protein